MRLRIQLDSATAEETRNFVFAWQRTAKLGDLPQIEDKPTVSVMGTCFNVALPYMSAIRFAAVLDDLRQRNCLPAELDVEHTLLGYPHAQRVPALAD